MIIIMIMIMICINYYDMTETESDMTNHMNIQVGVDCRNKAGQRYKSSLSKT